MENQEVNIEETTPVQEGFKQFGEAFNPEDYFTAHRLENESFEAYKIRQAHSCKSLRWYLRGRQVK